MAERTVDGLNIHYVDEGDGPPVVSAHGEPTWSFLWRKVTPPVRDAGFRCIAPDLPGFGRSDKPTDVGWYSYDRHVEVMAGFFQQLDPRPVTLVVHDWGGGIGPLVAPPQPGRGARPGVTHTGPFSRKQHTGDRREGLP